MEKLISEIEACCKEIDPSNSGCVDEIALGELLWHNMVQANPSEKDQESAVSKHAEIIVKAVRGFSDYQDCFCETQHYLRLGIERLSSKTALKCVKACAIMWGTEELDHRFKPEWANSAIQRCIEYFTVSSVEKLFDSNLLNNMKTAQLLLEEVSNAGDEYRELIKSNNYLHEIISNTQIIIDEANKLSSINKEMKIQLKTLKKSFSAISALCENNIISIIQNLEESVDLNKPNSNLLFEAYNTICDETEDCLIAQLTISQNSSLLQLAIYGINTQTENSKKYKNLLLESLVFLQLLLVPWNSADNKHLDIKKQIATNIYQYNNNNTTTTPPPTTGTTTGNIITGIIKQLLFWQNEWNGCYGDCGQPCLRCLQELIQCFPDIIDEYLLPNPSVIVLIHNTAIGLNGISNNGDYESAHSIAVKIMVLLDGKYDTTITSNTTSTTGSNTNNNTTNANTATTSTTGSNTNNNTTNANTATATENTPNQLKYEF